MSSGKESGWWTKWLGRAAFLASLSAMAAALYMTNDGYVMKSIIVGVDDVSASLVYLLLGSWAGVLISVVNNVIFGRRIDPDYPGMNFGSTKMQPMAVAAGLLGAFSTWCYLKAHQDLDPSVVAALANVAVIYLVVYDGVRGSISWRRVWPSLVAVVVGSFLVSLERLEFSFGALRWAPLLLLLIGRSGSAAFGKVVEQKGSRSSDGVTFSFWRMFWFAISATVLAVGFSAGRGSLPVFGEILKASLPHALPWVCLSLFFAYFGNTLENTAKRYGAVSVVAMFVGLQVVLGIPLTLTVNAIWPGALGELPSGVAIWVVRLVGVLFLLWGVSRVRKSDE